MTERLNQPIFLIVADNPSIRYWLKRHLETRFHLIEADRKMKAVEAAKHSALDFIIIDADFGDADSFEVCSELRRTPSNSLTPILLITNRLKKSYRDTALESGVTDFLLQPLDVDELEMKIVAAKQATKVRNKVSDLSSRIQAPKWSAAPNQMKEKFFLHNQALQLLSNAKKNNVIVTMLVIRIDRFSEIQSKLGATTCQEIIETFTDLLEQSVGKQDMIIPSTDGQFIVLLPGIKLEESQAIAEKLRKQIDQQRFSTKQGPIHLTASFAVSSIESTEKSFNHMIESATKSLKQPLHNKIFFIDKDKE